MKSSTKKLSENLNAAVNSSADTRLDKNVVFWIKTERFGTFVLLLSCVRIAELISL